MLFLKKFTIYIYIRLFWGHVGDWTARIDPKQLVLLDVAYVINNVVPL